MRNVQFGWDPITRTRVPLAVNPDGSLVSGPGGSSGGETVSINYCPNTMQKLKNGLPVSIKIFGDSLGEGAGSGTKYTDLLFNDTHVDKGFNLKAFYNNSNITYRNHCLGGTNAHYLMGFLAIEKSNYIGNHTMMSCIDNEYLGIPPIFKEKPDLAIISVGANGGTDHLALTEIFVRQLRAAGIEVIMTTSNPRKSNINAGDLGSAFSPLTARYSCALVDTHEEIKKAANSGTSLDDLFADDIHCAFKGHEIYAKLIYDVLTKTYSASTDNRLPRDNVYIPAAATSYANMPILVRTPSGNTGTTGTQGFDTSGFNFFRGRGPQTGRMTILATGNAATFQTANYQSFDLVFMADNAATVEVRTNDPRSSNKILKSSVSIPSAQGGTTWVVEGLKANDSISGVKLPYEFRSDGITIECTSGTAKLLGVIFYSKATNTFLTDATSGIVGVKTTGTWTASVNNGISQLRTDTNNDSCDINFFGDGIHLVFGANNSAGVVEVYIDDELKETVTLTWVSTSATNNIIKEYAKLGKGKHKCTIKLISQPADAALPSLMLLQVKTVIGDNFAIADLQ